MSETEPEADVQTEEEVPEDLLDGQPTVTVEIPLDDFHEQLVNQIEQADVDVETLLAANLRQPAESTIYKLYQQGKYAGGR